MNSLVKTKSISKEFSYSHTDLSKDNNAHESRLKLIQPYLSIHQIIAGKSPLSPYGYLPRDIHIGKYDSCLKP